MQTYNYSNKPLKDVMKDLSQYPPDMTMVSGTLKLDDEAKREALRRKKAHEAIEKLEGSGNGKLFDRLMEERKKDREREGV